MSVTHTHGDSSLSTSWLASNQHCSPSYVAVFDQLKNDPRSPTRGQLANHPLRHLQVDRNHSHHTWVGINGDPHFYLQR